MSKLQEKVALTMLNTYRIANNLPPLDALPNDSKHKGKTKLLQAQAAIDTICEALLSDEVVDCALNPPVADEETVFWSIVFDIEDDTDELPKIMAREIVKTALTAAVNKLKGE